MAIFKYVGRDGVYPLFRILNELVSDKNLYVTEISHHVHSPTEYSCRLPKRFNLHIILNGQVSINDRILKKGDGFFHHNMTYTAKKVCSEDFEETTITFDGYTAPHFVKERLGFDRDFEYFRLPENADITLLKDAVYTDFSNINLDMYMLSRLYFLASYIQPSNANISTVAALNPSKQVATNKHLLKAFDYISSHYTGTITVNELANHLHLSPNYMCKLFKSITGHTPQKYIIIYKITLSRHLISCTNYSISQIAAMVGYSDAKHFSQIFKSITDYSPTEYRKKTTEKDS